MRWSSLLIPTMKETPADAEVPSHRLMLRAGMIRQLASGVYSYLPLGFRALERARRIVREEMNRAGFQEVLLPSVHPLSLWKRTGRDQTLADVMYRMKDRRDRELVLGPTHEEVITDLVKSGVSSYKQLPLQVYQIQTKFRDEPRPRSGVIRSCEFIMKDAYSFHLSSDSLQASYDVMYDTYRRIFERCGVEVVICRADSGAMGGSLSHEFMAPSPSGEDTIVRCAACDYAASLEAAAARAPSGGVDGASVSAARGGAFKEVSTPGVGTVEDVSRFLNVVPRQLVKTLIVEADGEPAAVLVRGDHEVNYAKLARAFDGARVALASSEVIARITGAPVGFAGPVGLSVSRMVADAAVATMSDAVTGANKVDTHLVGVNISRDVRVDAVCDVRNVTPDDLCPSCGGALRFEQAIEVGHIFQLGTKYSDALEFRVANESGELTPVIMGCYGIGVNRIVASALEQHHDELGAIWPPALSPFDVEIVLISQKPDASSLAATLQDELEAEGVEVLLDDRELSAGVKFKDADLLGIPVRLVIGDKALARGEVEVQRRAPGGSEKQGAPPDQVVRVVSALLGRVDGHR